MHMVHVLKYIRTGTIIWLPKCQSVTQPWGTCVHGSQGIISNFWYTNKIKKTNSCSSNGKYSSCKVSKWIFVFPAVRQATESCLSVGIAVNPLIVHYVSLMGPRSLRIGQMSLVAAPQIYAFYGIVFWKLSAYSAIPLWHRGGTNIFWEN